MGVMHQILTPGVQNSEKPDLSAQMGRIGGNGAQCVGTGVEENVLQFLLVLQCDSGDWLG